MASFDVESLFTNIPLEETIDICVSEIFCDSEVVDGLTKEDFRTMLDIATKESMFLFDGEYYRQVDGVAMGSPLGPVFANIFLSHHEKVWLSQCPLEFKPLHFRRYVDDVFALFESEDHVKKFQSFLNSRHPNIKFTFEVEKDGGFPFLDVLVSRENNKFVTSVYRKPTFSGVYTNFKSFIPIGYKFGLVKTLLFRCFSLVSDFSKFHIEIEFLKKVLARNGYPCGLIDSCVRSFLEKLHRPKLVISTVAKKDVRIVLPFLGSTSLQARTRLVKLFQKSYPACQLSVIFKSTCTLGSFFSFKDKIPKPLLSGVVYKFSCSSCNATYIGKTIRHLKVRSAEHLGISPLTEKRLQHKVLSAVTQHILEFDHPATFDDFAIVDRCQFNSILEIKESLYIRQQKPPLNRTIQSAPLYLYE